MAKSKGHRRFIRVDGRVISSPRFDKKRDADLWYEQLKRQKNFGKFGLKISSDAEILFLDYARSWIKDRMQRYPKATWGSDEQRLRDYLLPDLADVPLAKITSKLVRAALKQVTDSGQSIQTRTRVKALASKILGDAFNEELIPFNPVAGLRFSDPRQGTKKPKYLTEAEATRYMEAAHVLGAPHLLIAVLGLCAGLRKSEMLGLKVSDVDTAEQRILVSRRLEQASLSVRDGTKGGKFETRVVPISKATCDILDRVLKEREDLDGFVFEGQDHKFMSPTTFNDYATEIAKTAQVEITPHGLRHTYGRAFVLHGGPIKALQAILGHSTSMQTDRYSELSGADVEGFGELVSFDHRGKSQS